MRTPQAFVLYVLADSFMVSSRRLALSARAAFVATRGDFWRWLRALVLWLRYEFWFDCGVLRELSACAELSASTITGLVSSYGASSSFTTWAVRGAGAVSDGALTSEALLDRTSDRS